MNAVTPVCSSARLADLCDRAERAIDPRLAPLLYDIVHGLRRSQTQPPSLSRSNYQSEQLIALGVSFEDGRWCKQDKSFASELYGAALARGSTARRLLESLHATPRKPSNVVSLPGRRQPSRGPAPA